MSKDKTPQVQIHPDGIIGSSEHNPDPRTSRGVRRRQQNHPEGIAPSHPAWKEGGLMCQPKPKPKKKKES
ncbi:uncharacterized protein METZ01_LOCUS109738 [marine metagenome]|uniref:Uncharacterized protein n=1 Tax=marine metagenome TaxID=408172 RepID=A0A381WWK6_9ZZZZ